MPGRRTTDALFIVKRMQEEYGEDKKLYICFMDLEKAFDRFPRRVMQWALRRKDYQRYCLPEIDESGDESV